MSWESPIDIIYQTVYKDISQLMDNCVMDAITEVGISVNKEELIKCINYDRNSYEKGYEDGRAEAIDECKNIVKKFIGYLDEDMIGRINLKLEQLKEER